MTEIYIETYGCSANQADSEMITGLLHKSGFQITGNCRNSNLNIINTCCVKGPTSNHMAHRIKRLMELGKPLVVAGCMPKVEKEIIEKIAPDASLIGPNSIEKIVDIVYNALKRRKVILLTDLKKPKVLLPRIGRGSVISIVEIASGCLSDCSYCCVKFARGKLFSYPTNIIIKRIEHDLLEGYKEIWITSQDNACYGKDRGTSLPKLLEKICEIDKKIFVRVGMMNPLHVKRILEELIEAYRDEKIFKFLHLPLESGSNRILELMNRGYQVEDFIEIVERFRKEFPEVTLSTDIIVGFPSESSSDFELTLDLIKNFKFDIVNISKFGPRPNTPASKMQPVDRKTINERTKLLHQVVKEMQLEINKKWIGWKGECLIDEKGTKEDTWIGRNFAYKPIVVYSEKNLLGKFLNVKITDAKANYLMGELNKGSVNI